VLIISLDMFVVWGGKHGIVEVGRPGPVALIFNIPCFPQHMNLRGSGSFNQPLDYE